MREHIRQLIEEARLPKVAMDGDGNRNLGSQVIRLAQMAAAVHMHEAVHGSTRDMRSAPSTMVEVRS